MQNFKWETTAPHAALADGEAFGQTEPRQRSARHCVEGEKFSVRTRILIILASAVSGWGLSALIVYSLIRLVGR